MLKEDIGYNAGKIWQVLSEREILSLIEIEELTGYKRDFILLALGWLSRENKIYFMDNKGQLSVKLNKTIPEIFY